MIVKIKLLKNSPFNPTSSSIFFYIQLDYLFPKSNPSVFCYSNFVRPTLFDKRDLLNDILEKPWTHNNTLKDIIDQTPAFVYKVVDEMKQKQFAYRGEYFIDKIYDLNELKMNSDIYFCRVKQAIQKQDEVVYKERYIFLTDIFFLMFDPIPDSKRDGRLLFWGDIKQITSCKGSSISTEVLILEWNEESLGSTLRFHMEFSESNVDRFMKEAKNRINHLSEFVIQGNYKGNEEEVTEIKNVEKLGLLIKYKEEILENNFSLEIVKELMSLYRKIIEILSAKNDESFKVYLEKVQKLLQNNKIQASLINFRPDASVKKYLNFRASQSAFN